MHLSFIIPLYNCLAYSQATFAGLLASIPAGLEFEILLVDDGSTDETRSWLAELPDSRVRVLLNEQNSGYARTNNRGAQAASGEILALLNNDLVLAPGWIEPILQVLARNPALGIVGNVQWNARTFAVDHSGIFINAKGKPEHDRRPILLFDPPVKTAIAVTGACMFVRRSLWNQLGGFDEGFINGGEDVDLCLRALGAGHRCAVATRSQIGHYVSTSPGRKRKDEENSCRLTRRWRDQFALLGTPAWSQHFLECDLNAAQAFADPVKALSLLAFASGLRSTPPPEALTGMHLAIEQELARWHRLLGPSADDPEYLPTPSVE